MKHLVNKELLVEESLYATANGYIGVRGTFEEGYPSGYETYRGTYLNGFFDTHDIRYSENAYGFPSIGETIVNVMDGQSIFIEVEDEVFSFENGQVLNMTRQLDLDLGINVRNVHWRSTKGHEFNFTFKRMASHITEELFLILIEIESLNYDGEIRIRSLIKSADKVASDADDPRVATEHILPMSVVDLSNENGIMSIRSKTRHSGQSVQVACRHNLEGSIEIKDEKLVYETSLKVTQKEKSVFAKYMIYTDSHKHSDPVRKGFELLGDVYKKGLPVLFNEQADFMRKFWDRCLIEIEGQEDLTYAIKYHQYQLLTAAGKDGVSQVAAKGLTGAGYEGHYFWDTEIYVIPFFTLTQPEIAKNILKYRHNILTKAKERSLELGHKRGAKMPWRTISGRECSSYFPAGTAQYHINADVAYGLIQYYLITKDDHMMREFGYETLVETAKLWLEVGHFKEGVFCIDDVTGPDEYTAIVNNNYYTNAMAKYHLEWTAKLYDKFNKDYMDKSDRDEMKKASESMKLPFDQDRGIHKQDDTFLDKAVWDFENTPKDKYPLLLNFHPLTIYRHQVLKQADTVLAHFLLDDTSDDIIKNSYEYYENITTHDSSLSPCVYGMMASRINQPERAYDFFMKTVYLDLKNLHGNTKDGLHIANAGGTFMAIAYGFGGLRIKPEGVSLRPTKPHDWTSYAFRFMVEDTLVKVKVSDRLCIQTTGPVTLTIDGQTYEIEGLLEVDYHGKH
ncbi:glycoside hydrolase family 65 protein [Acidaminobacter sp. JC074]|uniref:glycoside hydrolase family 65 protein n=1 Tax=Acidaminobacter sp. JC074 TaxID=2530199 RepID=UPI001F0D418B|nr:glycosyl hydrolase family 65 protein [Acidaminobacter sp. JC074]MCH4889065.1 glycoside hydrolase family 65 protein [Acidaminobacter sp. JC074]